MSEPGNTPGNTLTPAQVRINRIKLLVLWLVPVGLMAIAGAVYYLVQTGQLELGSKNHGALIRPPVQLHDMLAGLQAYNPADGLQTPASPWQGKWSMVVPALAACDERCRESLYLTRQLHIRLDKNANRVQRVLLSGPAAEKALTSQAFDQYVSEEHRLLKRYLAAGEGAGQLAPLLVAGSGETARFFLVDPQGWAMMAYFDEHDGNAILADLKHLLKYSRER